jgi:exopolysaccharide production protein ExoZ
MVLLAVLGLLCTSFVPADGVWLRVLLWGGGGTATLLGCVMAERWLDPLLPRIIERIGEASYSLYLTHGFILPIIGFAIIRSQLTGAAAETALVCLCMVVSTGAALVVYQFVELPVTQWLREEVGTSRGAFKKALTSSP